MLKIGIVGLPNAGKSTLFNALVSGTKAAVAIHPFTTIDKNIGVVEVPDPILFKLAEIEKIKKVTPTTITFIDIAGLIKGAHQGEGLGNQFLHHIREVDLILHVLRFFKNPDVPHVHSNVDPKEDLAIVNQELILADLENLEKKLKKEKLTDKQKEIIKKLINHLNQAPPGHPFLTAAVKPSLAEEEENIVKSLNLLSFKKQLILANIDEKEIAGPPKKFNNQPILSICARLEAEICQLPPADQTKFLKEYGLEKPAKENLILSCYQALDLITFYTIAKRNEARAWPLSRGAKAVAAAGKVHSDFAQKFIKVEAINAEELIKIGSWHKAKELGKIGLHGKDYLVADKDVLEFKIGI
ncbi:MAG: redox-regulated ATPase YchF [Microgenomates group bacterium]|nr:redox-regulated ATPase YchF [Microgenomates group bacterium]